MIFTGVIEPHARALSCPHRYGLTLLSLFCLKLGQRESVFAVRSPPYPRDGISDVFARGSITLVNTVIKSVIRWLSHFLKERIVTPNDRTNFGIVNNGNANVEFLNIE